MTWGREESFLLHGAWSSRGLTGGTMSPGCWHLFDDAILDNFVRGRLGVGAERTPWDAPVSLRTSG